MVIHFVKGTSAYSSDLKSLSRFIHEIKTKGYDVIGAYEFSLKKGVNCLHYTTLIHQFKVNYSEKIMVP